MKEPLRIICAPEELDQGLFGNVFTHTLQILPYLYEQKIFPQWELRSAHYGDPPDRITVPGVLDLAYTPSDGPYRTLSISEMRRRHGQILGGDWQTLVKIWNTFFRTPQRVLEAASGVLPPGRVLGVHYRGTDKQTSTWDSNPISADEFILLVQDYLAQDPTFSSIFVGTDEPAFPDRLRKATGLPVLDLGAAEFHLSAVHSTTRREKSDRAMLDCLLLSRCSALIQTSSALPSFTKIFNPDLEVYRTAASKLFSNMPYWPVAYIPVLPVTTTAGKEILGRTMQADWTALASMQRFRKTFAFVPRWPKNHSLFQMAERFGAADSLARLVTGFR